MYSLGPEAVNRFGDGMKAFSIEQMTDGEDDLAVEREPDRVSGACPVGREALGIGAVGDHDGFPGVAAGSGGGSAESIGIMRQTGIPFAQVPELGIVMK